MMTAEQIKGRIRNLAADNHVPAQLILQNFMLERLLERIAHSKYQKNFILKGGFLISAMTGIAARTTMDMDVTVQALPLSRDSISEIFQEILSVDVHDPIVFSLVSIETIREHDSYQGVRLTFTADFPPLKVPVKMDLTTGDSIFPNARKMELKLMFTSESTCIMAYNIETILAEKLETILFRGEMNTRPRDFYDIWLLCSHFKDEIDGTILLTAIQKTMEHRTTTSLLQHAEQILQHIANSDILKQYWHNYQNTTNYAQNCSFSETISAIANLLDIIRETQ